MIAKSLRAGSIAVAFTRVAGAADVTVTGGAGTAISAALSGLEVFRESDKAAKTIARDMAETMQGHRDRSHLTPRPQENRRPDAASLRPYQG